MDIKERFYANLRMIREEAEQLDEIKKLKKKYVKQARKQGNVFFDPPKTSLSALSTKSGNKYEKRLKYVEKAEKSLKEAEQLDEVTRKYALDKARKAEKKAYDYEDEGKRKSNMANAFGRKPEDSDRYDRESAEAYKKSSKKQKQNWKFREYAAKKK